MKITHRETAYGTLTHTLSLSDVPRELGVIESVVHRDVKRGLLAVNGYGEVNGIELARYLIAHRREPIVREQSIRACCLRKEDRSSRAGPDLPD